MPGRRLPASFNCLKKSRPGPASSSDPPFASEAAKTFGAAGCRIADIDAARAALDPLLGEGVTVLVKGSRVMGLDRLVKLLEADSTRVT